MSECKTIVIKTHEDPAQNTIKKPLTVYGFMKERGYKKVNSIDVCDCHGKVIVILSKKHFKEYEKTKNINYKGSFGILLHVKCSEIAPPVLCLMSPVNNQRKFIHLSGLNTYFVKEIEKKEKKPKKTKPMNFNKQIRLMLDEYNYTGKLNKTIEKKEKRDKIRVEHLEDERNVKNLFIYT